MRLFRRKKQQEQRLVPCPKCSQLVPADALDCPNCGADLRERPRRANEAPDAPEVPEASEPRL
jgi:hypothetical protein